MNDCWHRAKRPDPPPEVKRSTDELGTVEIEMIMGPTPRASGETDP
jgi:hypothetical protein